MTNQIFFSFWYQFENLLQEFVLYKIKQLTILVFTATVVFYIFVLIDTQDAQSNILFFDAIKSNILRMEFIINWCQPVA